MNIDKIIKEIKQKRRGERVTVHYRTFNANDASLNTDVYTIADKYIEDMGFHPLGTEWQMLNKSEAQEVLQNLLGFNLAYGSPTMLQSDSINLAHSFLALFPANTLFLTNGVWAVEQLSPRVARGPSWVSLTQSTFDGGIVCISPKALGFICVEDED